MGEYVVNGEVIDLRQDRPTAGGPEARSRESGERLGYGDDGRGAGSEAARH